MEMYGYEFIRESDLAHHGIKGQKWGVRRFQNDDGSLTNAGRSRYHVGKELSREKRQIQDAEYSRLKKSSKAYQNAVKETDRLVSKYGLDADDGGGGDRTRWSEETLRRAGDRYWQISEDMDALDEKFQEKAKDYARNEIIKKHGDMAISEIEYYEQVQTLKAAAVFVAAIGGMVWLSSRGKR